MKRYFVTVLLVLLAVWPGGAKVTTRVQKALVDYMKTSTFEGSLVGVLAIGPQGDTLAVLNPRTRLIPASNMKLITTGAAIRSLGADYRFKTELSYSGKIEGETLKGDLYIVGFGDPTTCCGDSIAPSPHALFQRWKGMLAKAGIKRIEGAIVGDGRFCKGMGEHPTWEYADIGTAYGTGWTALSFYRNKQDFAVSAGSSAGTPVNVKVKYPETPWMDFTSRALTGPTGSGNSLFLYTSDLAPVSELRGTFAVGRKPKTEEYSNKFPELTLAYYFYKYLTKGGFPVTGGKVDGREFHARLVLGAALTEDVDRVGLAHFKFGGCFDDHHRAVRILRRAFLAVGQVLRFQFCQIRQAVVKARVAVCCVDCRNDAAEYDGA